MTINRFRKKKRKEQKRNCKTSLQDQLKVQYRELHQLSLQGPVAKSEGCPTYRRGVGVLEHQQSNQDLKDLQSANICVNSFIFLRSVGRQKNVNIALVMPNTLLVENKPLIYFFITLVRRSCPVIFRISRLKIDESFKWNFLKTYTCPTHNFRVNLFNF